MKPYEIHDQPSNAQITENPIQAEGKPVTGRTGPIDDVKREKHDEPVPIAKDSAPPFSKSGK